MNSRRIELGIKAIDLYYKDDNTEVNNVTTKEGEEKMVNHGGWGLGEMFYKSK